MVQLRQGLISVEHPEYNKDDKANCSTNICDFLQFCDVFHTNPSRYASYPTIAQNW